MPDNKSARLDVRRLNRILSMLHARMAKLTDEGRDLPIRWNVMHTFSSAQLAKLLALRRGLDPELAGIAAALHDIAVVETGKRRDHARRAAGPIRDLVRAYNETHRRDLPEITADELAAITRAAVQHSDKAARSDDPLVELLKDVDAADRYLHGIQTEGAYWERAQRVLRELGLPF